MNLSRDSKLRGPTRLAMPDRLSMKSIVCWVMYCRMWKYGNLWCGMQLATLFGKQGTAVGAKGGVG